jgi:hypothetical protein
MNKMNDKTNIFEISDVDLANINGGGILGDVWDYATGPIVKTWNSFVEVGHIIGDWIMDRLS